jgi:hypothetical protein
VDLLSFFISRDFLRAAVFGCMTFLLAALSSELMASVTAAGVSFLSLDAISFSARVTAVLTPLRIVLLRSAFLTADLADFSAVLVFGNSAYLLS